MTLDGIFSVLEGISNKIDDKERKVANIKSSFDETLGIDSEKHDKVASLLEQYEDSEDTIAEYDKKINETTQTIAKLDKSIKALEGNLQRANPQDQAKIQDEIDKKNRERDEAYEERKTLKNSRKKEDVAKDRTERKLKKYGVDAKDAVKKKKKMDKDILAASEDGFFTKILKNVKNSIYYAAAKLLVSVIEFGIGKATEYARVAGENLQRTISATTAVTMNKLTVGLEAWQDALNGSYSAQIKANENQIEMLKMQNANTMASYKLENTWTNWIPIWGTLNKYNETALEIEQRLAESRLENSNRIISKVNEYTKRTDEYLRKQDDAVHKYQALNGLTVEQTDIFEKRMLANGAAFAKFGKSVEDALKIQNSVTEQSGRAVKFSDEDFKRSFGVGRLVGEDNLTQFQGMMNIFNMSVSGSADIMYDMYNYANKMGLSQQKLTKSVLSNIRLANKYDFKNGTKGFIELAKWAENARMSIGSFSSAIEKIQSGGLEGVIKQGAGLQVLGGNIAMMADPIAMMYEAGSDQLSYAKRIQGMLKGYGSFNRSTGETVFSWNENMMMRAMAEQLNMPVEDLKDMARGSRQKEYVKAQMRGTLLSSENQDAVANMAQYDQKSKRWYVNEIGGGKIDVANMTDEDMKRVLSNNRDENAEKYAQGTFSAAERIKNATEEINSKLGAETFGNFMDNAEKSISATLNAYTNNLNEIAESIRKNRDDAYKDLVDQLKDLNGILSKYKDAAKTMQVYENENLEDANYVKRRMEDTEGGKTHAEYDAAAERYMKADKEYQDSSGFGALLKWYKRATATADLAKAAEADAIKNNDNSFGLKVNEFIRDLFNPSVVRKEYDLRQKYDIKDGVLSGAVPSVASASQKVTTFNDGMVSANGAALYSQAASITPIHDGSVRMAKSDPGDTGLFAKDGGPFDTLFNGVFRRVDDLYDTFAMYQKNGVVTPGNDLKGIPAEADERAYGNVANVSRKTVYRNTDASDTLPMGYDDRVPDTERYSDNVIKFDTLKVELGGRLELSSEGQSVDIISEIQNNPVLLRTLTRMIAKNVSSAMNGGKGISDFSLM